MDIPGIELLAGMDVPGAELPAGFVAADEWVDPHPATKVIPAAAPAATNNVNR